VGGGAVLGRGGGDGGGGTAEAVDEQEQVSAVGGRGGGGADGGRLRLLVIGDKDFGTFLLPDTGETWFVAAPTRSTWTLVITVLVTVFGTPCVCCANTVAPIVAMMLM